MSVQKVMASELDVRRYVTELNLNPENVFYQSISSTNVSTTNAQWTITSPNKRSFLLAYAAVNWQPTIQHQQENGTAENWGESINYLSTKGLLPWTNAMASITMSVNGNTITLSQPRRFMEGLAMANVTREEARVCYESGYPDDMGGRWNITNPGDEKDATVDHGFLKNENSFNDKLLRAQGAARYGAFNNTAMIGNNGFQETGKRADRRIEKVRYFGIFGCLRRDRILRCDHRGISTHTRNEDGRTGAHNPGTGYSTHHQNH